MTDPHAHPESRALEELDRAQRLIASLPGESAQQERLAAVGLLSAFVAHECRNRLTPIIGYARAAARAPADAELVRKALSRIAASAQDLAQFSELILSSATAGRTRSRVESAWRLALEAVQLDEHRSGMRVTTDIERGLEVAISQTALTHVLENLLRNACNAAPGGLEVSFAARSTRNTVALYLVDSADGMAPPLTEIACEPMTSGGGGTGLGLALCRFLVESAGGRLIIDSEPGEGTTVLVELPTPAPVESGSPTPAPAAKHPRA